MMPVVQEDADIAAGLAADGNVGQAVAVEVRHDDVGRCFSRRQGEGSAESAVGLLKGDLDAVVQRVGHDEIIESVAGEVRGSDTSRQSGGGEGGAAVDGAGGGDAVERDGEDEVVGSGEGGVEAGVGG